jgi:hypothetical protein
MEIKLPKRFQKKSKHISIFIRANVQSNPFIIHFYYIFYIKMNSKSKPNLTYWAWLPPTQIYIYIYTKIKKYLKNKVRGHKAPKDNNVVSYVIPQDGE